MLSEQHRQSPPAHVQTRGHLRPPIHRPGNTFMTVAEIATELRVSKMTIYRLLSTGELEGIRVGRSIRVSERAFDAYQRAAQGYDWDPAGGEA